MGAENLHHPLGPSKWPAWACCPCYAPGPESDASRGGTEAHRLLGAALAGHELSPSADPYLVGVAEWAAAQLGLYGGGWSSEVGVEIRNCGVLHGVFGTADAVQNDAKLRVADLKAYSRGESEYWAQLMGYAIGLCQKTGHHAAELLVLHGGSRKVESRTVTVDECVAECERIVSLHLDPMAEPAVCRQCSHCAAVATCSAVLAKVGEAVATCSAVLAKVGEAVSADVAGLTVGGVFDWLDWLPALEAFVLAVKDEAMAIAENCGGEVTRGTKRWKIVEKAGARKIGDALAAFRAVSDFMDSSHFMAVCNVPVTGFEKAIRSCNRTGAQAKDIIDSVSERGAPSRSLVAQR